MKPKYRTASVTIENKHFKLVTGWYIVSTYYTKDRQLATTTT